MPSHRADTLALATTTVRSPASEHPPRQRRRDLRPGGGAVALLKAPDGRRGDPATGLLRTSGALALDPFFTPLPTVPLRVPAESEPAGVARAGLPAERPAAPAGLPAGRQTERQTGQPADGQPADGLAGQPADEQAAQPAVRPAALPSRRALRAARQQGAVAGPDVAGPAVAPVTTVTATVTTTVSTAAVVAPPAATASAAQAPAVPSSSRGAQAWPSVLHPVPPAAAPAPRRGPTLGLPQVGIVGALGLATIAAPLCGAFAGPPATKTVSNTVSTAAVAGALQPLPPFPLVSRAPLTALDDVRLLPDEEPAAAVPARLAAPRTLLVDRASRSDQRAVLPGCDGQVPDVSGVLNGRLPASMLCTLWDKRRQLRSDAAVAIAKLNILYTARFGHPMAFNDAYRSLDQQFAVKAERGGFAARPGTSEHGWGLAVDLADGVETGPSSATYQWMREHGPAYGWSNPAWALAGGAGPYEPWHWEYLPGEKSQATGD